jgi:hypothetical protein
MGRLEGKVAGSIIGTRSVSGVKALPGQAGYSSAKYGVVGRETPQQSNSLPTASGSTPCTTGGATAAGWVSWAHR